MNTLITLYINSVEVDDDTSHSNDVLLEAKDELKEDKVLEGQFYNYM